MKLSDYIKGYDEMTEEEKAKALEEFEFAPDLTGYVKKEDYEKMKTNFDKASSELASKKKEDREKLSEAERMKAEWEDERKAMKEQLEGFQRKSTVENYGKRLAQLGFENADAMAESLPNEIDDNFFKGLEKWKTEVEKNAKAEVVKETARPSGGTKTETTVTKEQFEKMSYREMVQLKESNPDLYTELSGGAL